MRQDHTLAKLGASNDPLSRLIYERVTRHLGGAPDEETAERVLVRLSDDVKETVEAGFIEGTRVYRDRQILLQAVDSLWIRHLTDLDVLRQGIGLRAYGQRDPLVSFQKEAHEMYQGLLAAIQTTVVNNLFRLPNVQRATQHPERRRRSKRTHPRSRKRRR
jgi:preprotein translocase subunit SecA